MLHGTRAFSYPYSLGTHWGQTYMSGSRLAFIGDHSLGTVLNDQSLGDSPYVPAVWDDPLMSDAPRGVECYNLLCLLELLFSAS